MGYTKLIAGCLCHLGNWLDGSMSVSLSRFFRSPVFPTFQGNSSTHIKQTIVKVNFMMLWGWQKKFHDGKAYQTAKLLCTLKYNDRSKRLFSVLLFYTFQQETINKLYTKKAGEKSPTLFIIPYFYIQTLSPSTKGQFQMQLYTDLYIICINIFIEQPSLSYLQKSKYS